MTKRIWLITFFSLFLLTVKAFSKPELYVYSLKTNDLFLSLQQSKSIKVVRLLNIAEISKVPKNRSVLILSDTYPDAEVLLNEDFYRIVKAKNLRVFIEYPSYIPNIQTVVRRDSEFKRVVVNSGFFSGLDSLSVLQVNGLSYLDVREGQIGKAHLVAARVAGFDSAIYGLPKQTSPLLFELPDHSVLISLTNLSNFVSGRYSPNREWGILWKEILQFLLPGTNIPLLKFEPKVQTVYTRNQPLPADAQQKGIRSGIEWFENAKMLIHPTFLDSLKVLRKADIKQIKWNPNMLLGDGTLGVFECIFSEIGHDGQQPIGIFERGDCNSETAMAFALAGKLLDNKRYLKIAENLIDYYLFNSNALDGKYSDPKSAAYGLIPWGISNEYWRGLNYGDDNARFLLAAITTASILKTDKWDETIMKSLMGLLRTTGKNGFRGTQLVLKQFEKNDDWRFYSDRDLINLRPHFESYLWACFLWAYDKTGDKLFLETAQKGLDIMMKNYPDNFTWTNGLAQEKARMILPLAWLVRINNSPQNRVYLNTVVQDMIKLQDASGAIREELGDLRKGRYPPPRTNEAYGTNEASLIAQNGDPVTDLIYTANYVLLGLHEASYATNDPLIKGVEDRLADFLLRIQVRSGSPALHGGWMRSFDFERYEHWGSNADTGWGAWCIETGWSQSWILSILSLREMDSSVWDLSMDSKVKDKYGAFRNMLDR
ncbi:hypothetical protein [Daejeonella sp. JGW-45]|uniref:hypothetical protein n=1 Tax=Daejeonella sp. JGW-45 TaxID=3034148 RepID=UPI0023EDC42A|nr:hypothetical protein [Daejeonella sp. JGW-45]